MKLYMVEIIQDGKTENTNIIVTGGTITDIYGGGDKAETDLTNLNIGGNILRNIYGRGK